MSDLMVGMPGIRQECNHHQVLPDICPLGSEPGKAKMSRAKMSILGVLCVWVWGRSDLTEHHHQNHHQQNFIIIIIVIIIILPGWYPGQVLAYDPDMGQMLVE
eukprot:1493326-Amphidinium_carterae.1